MLNRKKFGIGKNKKPKIGDLNFKCADCGTSDFVRIKGKDNRGHYEKLRYIRDLVTGETICQLCLDLRSGKTAG